MNRDKYLEQGWQNPAQKQITRHGPPGQDKKIYFLLDMYPNDF